MPVVDTEFLFALNPKDKRHAKALEMLSMENLKVPDTALFEFQAVLRARGRNAREITRAMRALKYIFGKKIKEVQTISIDLFILQAEIEEKYGLSYFDSLIAASALSVDGVVISNDRDFDRIDELKRVSLSNIKK